MAFIDATWVLSAQYQIALHAIGRDGRRAVHKRPQRQSRLISHLKLACAASRSRESLGF